MKKLQRALIAIILIGILITTITTGIVAINSVNEVEKTRSEILMSKELEVSVNWVNEIYSDTEYSADQMKYSYSDKLAEVGAKDDSNDATLMANIKNSSLRLLESNEYISSIRVQFDNKDLEDKYGFGLSKYTGEDKINEIIEIDNSNYSNYIKKWYKQAKKYDESTWLNTHKSNNGKTLIASYAVPIYEDGDLCCIISVDLNEVLVCEGIKNTRIYKTGFITVMNSAGEIYYSQKRLNVSEQKLSQLYKNADEHVTVSYMDKGQGMKLSAAELDNGNYLLMSVADSELYKDRNQVMITVILIMAAIICVIATLVILISNRLFKKYQIDALTGCLNRSAYTETIVEFDRSVEHENLESFTICVFDVNGLKKINDKYGHLAGDKFLQDAASILKERFKDFALYRIGGDEFVIIGEKQYQVILEHLLERFRNEMIEKLTKDDMDDKDPIIASGIATFDSKTDNNLEEVVRKADEDMYNTKKRYYEINPKMDRRRNRQ